MKTNPSKLQLHILGLFWALCFLYWFHTSVRWGLGDSYWNSWISCVTALEKFLGCLPLVTFQYNVMVWQMDSITVSSNPEMWTIAGVKLKCHYAVLYVNTCFRRREVHKGASFWFFMASLLLEVSHNFCPLKCWSMVIGSQIVQGSIDLWPQTSACGEKDRKVGYSVLLLERPHSVCKVNLPNAFPNHHWWCLPSSLWPPMYASGFV